MNVKNLDLNLSMAALGAGGSQVLECIIANIKCISSLDISDNGSSLLTLLSAADCCLQYDRLLLSCCTLSVCDAVHCDG